MSKSSAVIIPFRCQSKILFTMGYLHTGVYGFLRLLKTSYSGLEYYAFHRYLEKVARSAAAQAGPKPASLRAIPFHLPMGHQVYNYQSMDCFCKFHLPLISCFNWTLNSSISRCRTIYLAPIRFCVIFQIIACFVSSANNQTVAKLFITPFFHYFFIAH